MIEGEEDYWEHPDGTRYKVGDQVPVIRMNGVVLINDFIIKGTCEMCEWEIIGPTSFTYDFSHAHVATHIATDLADDFRRHPDFTE